MDKRFDRRRWVRDEDGNVGYLGSNGHSVPGHFLAYWTHQDLVYTESLDNLTEMSRAAADWLEGFFAGSEPEPEPVDRSYDWEYAVRRFRSTGIWNPNGETCEECGADRVPSELYNLCEQHGGEPKSLWPEIIDRHEP